MSDQFKVVAVNGSPHLGIGNTEQMLAMVGEGLKEHGGELEVISVAGKDIGYCVGCAVCLKKGACWKRDDHKAILKSIEQADAVILACPVYIFHVTAQMKCFLDRSLAWGHKPRNYWKPGLALSVAAAGGEREVAEYLTRCLRFFGAYSVGSFTSLAVGPGEFMGKEHVEQRARDLSADLARAVKGKRRMPATGDDLAFWQFMSRLVKSQAEFMAHDFKHWQEAGLFDSFENYVGQKVSKASFDPEVHNAWVKEMIAAGSGSSANASAGAAPPPAGSPPEITSCREMIAGMPVAFNPDAANGMNATIQFEVSGDEEFVSHLTIADKACTHADGPADSPSLTIKTPAEVWLAISRGELDGQQAFVNGQYKVEGDMTIILALNRLFPSA